MTIKADEIYNKLKYIDMQYTGNVQEDIIVYQVKNKQAKLCVMRTPSGKSYNYKAVFIDFDTQEMSEIDILFEAYPQKGVSYGMIIGTNNNRIYYSNSGIQKAFREMLKAISKLYNMPICKQI